MLPIAKPSMGFYDFEQYEQLAEAAKATDPVCYASGMEHRCLRMW